ncbi:hypothetical protein DES53_105342 [Roseimicrobium gellanilyticum]|uniref:Uncharacterized protein n=1 Tax=Roseimicrobium gellanilyticum TaxID=748857 RepID=A0A366HLY9_9BACT|nr:hypothetical protein [Roseimicrobium gellanilyticum]RBP43943.1 hypothetical protein DES53_105342 [Roseimicrobium gellanilyticum]
MSKDNPSVHDKAIAIFRELVGNRAEQFSVPIPDAQQAAQAALAGDFNDKTALDIAFHMTDWNSDAAFVTALLLYPERFTPEEIREGIGDFLVHAPNHLAAAARQYGYPVQDTFGVGALDGWREDDESEDT